MDRRTIYDDGLITITTTARGGYLVACVDTAGWCAAIVSQSWLSGVKTLTCYDGSRKGGKQVELKPQTAIVLQHGSYSLASYNRRTVSGYLLIEGGREPSVRRITEDAARDWLKVATAK